MSERATCGCVVGGLHRYACAGVGHVDGPAPEPADQNRADVVLSEAEREQRCREEQISHEHYTRDGVERIVADRLAAEQAEHAAEVAKWRGYRDECERQYQTKVEECGKEMIRAEAAEATVARARADVVAAGRHLDRVLADGIYLAVHDAQNALARVRAALDGERAGA